VLLITLGELDVALSARAKPFHIPTVAQEVFDVFGAGDTVIAAFTLAIAAGASSVEAAMLSNTPPALSSANRHRRKTPEELLKVLLVAAM